MFNSNGFLLLYALSCTCTCSDLNINGRTVIAKLYRPIELEIQEMSACNLTVEWIKPGSILCLKFDPVNKSQCVADCCKKVQFHCQNSSFVLNSVAPEDEGKYSRTIILQDGTMKTINITLKIMYPPNITNLSINSSYPTLIITCKASGGNVTYSWLKNGQASNVMNQTLMVPNSTRSDCANYTCVVTSEGGSSMDHVSIDDGSALCIEGLDQRYEIKIGSALICVLGLCITAVCIKKLHKGICNNESLTPEERGHHLYDEPSNVQSNPSEVVQLPYVYTDFIPMRSPADCGEALYSTIGEVQQQGQTLKVVEQAQTMQALEQIEPSQVQEEAKIMQASEQT